MQKEIRRGDERAAMFWCHLLYETSSYYAWKRVLVTAAEDIGWRRRRSSIR
jgi:replication-associated recombination protein RarA